MKIKFFFLLLALSIQLTASAQSVDPFTGDLNYQVPLLTVPSPSGGGVSISAQYSSGIMVDQAASEIGLGWSLNTNFAITRNVVNIPDDAQKLNLPTWSGGFYGKSGILRGFPSSNENQFEKDLLQYSKRLPEESNFFQPAYDKYYVNCIGISGEIKPYTFKFNNITKDGNDEASTFFINNTEKINFHYLGDFSGTLNSRHYPTITNSGTTTYLPNDEVTYDSETNAQPFKSNFSGTLFNNMDYSEAINQNRLVGKRYIEYFTNQQINDHFKTTSPTILPALAVNKFIDYKTDHSRVEDNFEMEGLGAFRVTDESGNVYHFSLPVYINSTLEGAIPLNNDYSKQNNSIFENCDGSWGPSLEKVKSPVDATTGHFVMDLTNKNAVIEKKENLKYAYAWLLVAITGPDYVDVNENHIVDEADKGYWVSYDWKQWVSNFVERTPQYGFSYSYTPNKIELNEGRHLDSIVSNSPYICNTYEKLSNKTGNYKAIDQEIYYLDKISSSTHSALFVHDVRNDDHSAPVNYDDTYEEDYVLQELANTDVELSYRNDATTKRYNSSTGIVHDKQWRTGSNLYGSIVAINPTGYNKIELNFLQFEGFTGLNDMEIYIGTNTNPDYVYNSANLPPATLLIDDATVTINTGDNVAANKFAIQWRGMDLDDELKPLPQLSTKRILLVKNNQLSNLPAKENMINTSTNTLWGVVTSSTRVALNVFYSEEWYQDNKTTIDPLVLKNVEFDQDYSLSKKYHKNIYTEFGGTSKSYSPREIQDFLTTANNSLSGKLSLKKIIVKEMNSEQLMPSIVFDYYDSNSTENPDYNPKNADYWGYHKSDATDKGFSGYQTSTSKDHVDTWSLKKITSPMGGTIELEYESDVYSNVVYNEELKGPSRIYPIENIFFHSSSNSSGVTETSWKTYWEDETADIWENNSITGVWRSVVLPVDGSIIINDNTFTLTNNTSGYDLINNARIYGTNSGYTTTTNEKVYHGDGYVRFDLPTNTNVYGGGIRVKNMITRNGTQDAYKVEYTYENGVCSEEPDRFSEESYKMLDGVIKHKRPLITYQSDLHVLRSEVGYGKTTITNKGQLTNNTNNIGESVLYYTNAPNGMDNFKPYFKVVESEVPPEDMDTTFFVMDFADKFSKVWGTETESQIKDFAGNIISKTKTDYVIDDRGLITELSALVKEYNCCASEAGPGFNWTKSYVSIDRHYQPRVASQTSYEKNSKTRSLSTDFDEITGNSIASEMYDINNIKSVQLSSPLWKQVAAYGSKAMDYDNMNFLGVNYWTKTIPNIELTDGNDFGALIYSTWKTERKIRYTSNIVSTNDVETLNYPIPDKVYQWNGPLSKYGLFEDESLVAFNPSSIHANWRYNSENLLFDEFGDVLCSKTFNDRFSANKYQFNGQFLSAACSNSNYGSFTFSGFENIIAVPQTPPATDYTCKAEGEIQLPSRLASSYEGNGSTIVPHTGKKMLALLPEETAAHFSLRYPGTTDEAMELMPGRTYRISVWVHSSSPSDATLLFKLNNAATASSISKNSSQGITVGSWIQLNLDVTVPDDYESPANNDFAQINLVGGGTSSDLSYFDDLSFRCADCGISANIVDERTGLVSATLNNNNFATYLEYDKAGRLLKEYIEIPGVGKKLQKRYKYHYFRTN